MSIISVKDMCLWYGDHQALKNVNIEIPEKSITAFIGPSGCGKSTILNMLSNILEPTSGIININGQSGYMFQRDHLFEWRNIFKNIFLGIEIKSKKHNDFDVKYIKNVATDGMSEHRAEKIDALSEEEFNEMITN